MTGEGDPGGQRAADARPPLVDGEVILQAGVLGLTYLVPVVVLRACLRVLNGLRRRLGVSRPRLAPAVIELKGRG